MAARGQSSIEYLMTYGWALIILVVVISVLYSIGVFDPQQYMNEECLFQPSLQCKSMQLVKDAYTGEENVGEFNLKINNGLGYALQDVTAEVKFQSIEDAVYIDNVGEVPANGEISFTFGSIPSGKMRVGTVEKAYVTLKYKLEGSDTFYTSTGVISVRVSP